MPRKTTKSRRSTAILRSARCPALVLSALLALSACDMTLLSTDGGDDGAAVCGTSYTFDEASATREARDCHGDLLWYEEYGFDGSGNTSYVRRMDAGDELQYSYVYEWEGGGVSLEAYFDFNGSLAWYRTFEYQDGLPTRIVEYDDGDVAWWVEDYVWDGEGNLTERSRSARSDASESLSVQWVYAYEYSPDGDVTKKSAYDSSQTRTGYVEKEFDTSGYLSRESAFVASGTSDSAANAFSVPYPSSLSSSAPSRIGDTDSGASSSLTPPDPPEEAPITPTIQLVDTSVESAWYNVSTHDPYGTTTLFFRVGDIPYRVERDDTRLDSRVATQVAYDNELRPITNSTTVDSEEVLRLEISYQSNGLLSSISTSGSALLLPLDYGITYQDTYIPQSISISQGGALLQRFEYRYGDQDLSALAAEIESALEARDVNAFSPSVITTRVHEIEWYDGDEHLIGTYVFAYDEQNNRVTIDAELPDDGGSNGRFVVQKDEAGNIVTLESFDADGERVWHYEFDYDEYGNQIEETRYELEEATSEYDVVVPDTDAALESLDFSLLFG